MKAIFLTALLLLGLSFALGCKSKTDDSSKTNGDERASKLMMSSDSEVCVNAMKCCEQSVKLTIDAPTPSDYNLKCSGVAMADTDETCTQFAKGYAALFKSKDAELPAVCK